MLITDSEGYLLNIEDWDENIAVIIAKREGLTLNAHHWVVIHFMRTFYLQYRTTPPLRAVVKLLLEQFGEEVGNSLYLNRLFPAGVAKQSSKIAGLKKPTRCI